MRTMLYAAAVFVLLIFFALPMRVSAEGGIGFSQIKTRGEAAGDEFIELLNTADSGIDLNGYKLIKTTASGTHYTVLTFGAQLVQPHSYALLTLEGSGFTAQADKIYKTALADNNTLTLVDTAGSEIDHVSWGDGQTLPNHAANESYQRQDNQWRVATFVLAHRSGDLWSQHTDLPPVVAPALDPLPSVRINEAQLLVAEGDSPWIELFFAADEAELDAVIELDGSVLATIKGSFLIRQYSVLNLPYPISALPHTLALRTSDGRIIETIHYPTQSEARLAYARRNDDNWAWTALATGGRGNIFVDLPAEPVCDTPSVAESPVQTPTAPVVSPPSTIPPTRQSGRVYINEVFANPSGDEASDEFIELINEEAESITLAGWKIADAAKSTTLGDLSIAAHGYLILHRVQTGLSLNNTVETVSLTDANGHLLSSFSYESAAEDKSFNRADPWYEASPTPNAQNAAKPSTPVAAEPLAKPAAPENTEVIVTPTPAIPAPTAEIAVAEDTPAPDTSTAAQAAPSTTTKVINKPAAKATTFAAWPQVKTNSKVTMVGVIVAPPGLFGEKSATMEDVTGAYAGIEIYFSAADWPTIDSGDIISVSGKKSTAKSGDRLLVSAATDIEVIDHMDMDAKASTVAALSRTQHRTLVELQGRIIDAKNGIFTFSDASGELRLSAKRADFELPLGDLPLDATVSGLFIQGKTAELWLRRPDDIEPVEIDPPTVSTETTADRVLPQTTITPANDAAAAPWVAPLAAVGSAGGISWYFFQDALRQQGLRLLTKLRK